MPEVKNEIRMPLMKIRVEVEVPDGSSCRGCSLMYEDETHHDFCSIFNNYRILLSEKCPQCRAAEVKEDESEMELTDEMLAAAMSVAVKTGIFPRYADEETYLDNWHRMKHCLIAALKEAEVKEGE